MKTCSKCGETKTLDAFTRDKRRSDGYGSWCRSCHATAGRARHQSANPHPPMSAERQCTTCGETKPLAEFPRRKDSPDGYRRDCKACRRDYMRKYEPGWRAANPDKTRARWRRYYEKKGVEWDRERVRQYKAANRERLQAYARAYMHRTRAGTAPDPDLDAYADWLRLQPCSYCGGEDSTTIDHVVPLSRGGRHVADNIVASCLSCNSSKGKKLLGEWRPPLWG